MDYTFAHYQESAAYLRARLGEFVPKTLMILGSGLGYLGDVVESPIAVPYEDIPHFRPSTAPGHKGRLVFGTLRGKPVAVMQGRMHHYEGYSFEETAYAVRVAKLLGAENLVVTNAAGSVNTAWQAGDLMLITDQIKIFMESPLRGPNLEQFGPRFPDSSHLYTPRLQALARRKAVELGVSLREGVYMYFPGPQYETPAEVRLARILGADAVGMSTAIEAIAAVQAGLRVAGLSLITNLAAGIQQAPLSHGEVTAAAERSAEGLRQLLTQFLRLWAKGSRRG